MRILLASDLHGSADAATAIRDEMEGLYVDLFVACGDITNFGPESFAEDFLRGIPVKTFAVPGNCDPPGLVDVLEELGVNLHGKREEFGGRTFIGVGGSNPTPFDTMFEISEDEISRILEPVMEPASILISHPPPYGFCDIVRGGEHTGSRAVRASVDKFEPWLVMTGHIHEARGVYRGVTTVVNPGLAANGYVALIDIDGEVGVELMQLAGVGPHRR